MSDLHALSVHEASRLLRERQISSVELTRAVLDRIAAVEERVQAYTTVTEEVAMQQAAKPTEDRRRGHPGR